MDCAIFFLLVSFIVPSIQHVDNRTAAGYQISQKPCRVKGQEGKCMFVWECVKTEGTPLGMCMERFMFGSCCAYDVDTNLVPDPSSASTSSTTAGPSLNKTLLTTLIASKPPAFVSSVPELIENGNSSSTDGVTPSTVEITRHPNDVLSFDYAETFTTSNTTASTTTTEPTTTKTTPSTTTPLSTTIAQSTTTTTTTTQPTTTSTTSTTSITTSTTSTTSTTTSTTTTTIKTTQPTTTASSTTTGRPTTKPSSLIKLRPKPYKIRTTTRRPVTSTAMTTTKSITVKPLALTLTPPIAPAHGSFLAIPESANVTWSVNEESNTISPLDRPLTTRNPVPPSIPSTNSTTISTTTKADTSTTSISTTASPVPVAHTLPISQKTTTKRPTVPGSVAPYNISAIVNSTIELTTATPNLTVTSVPSSNPKYECGVPPLLNRQEGRIVGGTNAKFGSWPWQVSVRRTSFFGFSSTHRCGGALLNEQWAITAGHCVDDLLVSQIRLRMGEFDFSSTQEPYGHIERGINKKIVHPKYNFFTYEYDLALVRLEEPITFQPNIAPICLPATDESLIGQNGTVTGWGRLSEGGTLPSQLQQVTVPIVSNEKCKNMFLKAGRNEHIPDIFMCAGYEEGGRDSCQGDSGGPLQIRGRDGRYFLAGIISWGIGCAEANLPGVCTRISKFTPWILENVT